MRHPSAFTLIELVIVISILATLASVSFLSFQQFSSSARDSQRLSDMGNIAKTIEIYQVNSGSYPLPDNSFSVTYSGAKVWYQGTAGAGLIQKTNAVVHWGISMKPIDPLTQAEYSYSTIAQWREYEIKGKLEWTSPIWFTPPLVDTVYAANSSTSILEWNYNEVVTKTNTGGIIYVLAIPSLITNTGSSGQTITIESNALSGALIRNNSTSTGAVYNPNVIVFSWSALPSDDSSSGITNLVNAIKTAYSGSEFATQSSIARILNSQPSETISIGCAIIANLGGKCVSSSSSTPPAPPVVVVHDTWTLQPLSNTSTSLRLAFWAATVNNKIYTVGGIIWATTQDTMEEYDVASGGWTVKAHMNIARMAPTVAVYNNQVYAIGWTVWTTWLKSVEVYDPVLNKWTLLANMSNARSAPGVGVVNGKIYVFGGDSGNTVEMYDPVGNIWTLKTPMTGARINTSSVVMNGKIYIIGGNYYGNDYSSDVIEEFDPTGNAGMWSWTTKAHMPTARKFPGVGVVDNKIYVLGWSEFDGESSFMYNKIEEYDPAANTWKTKIVMPFLATQEMGFWVVSLGNMIYTVTTKVYSYQP